MAARAADCMRAAMMEESMPPERKQARGTSLINWDWTAEERRERRVAEGLSLVDV